MMKFLFKYILLILFIQWLSYSLFANDLPNYNFSIPFDISYATFSGEGGNMSDSVVDLDRVADSLTNLVLNGNKLTDILDPTQIYTLPLGIAKDIGGFRYVIVFDGLKIYPNKASINVYMSLVFPGLETPFGFIAENVIIGPNGIAAARLKMRGNRSFNLMGQDITLVGDSTYIDWDCNGYKTTTITGFVSLKTDMFVKEDPQSRQRLNGAPIRGWFSTTFSNKSDIVTSLRVEPFQLKSVEGFGYYPGEVSFDLSDLSSPQGFPANYSSGSMAPGAINTWRGIFIKSFTVKMPKKFNNQGTNSSIGGTNLIIDCDGFTGAVTVNTPVIALDQGNIGGWKFSMEKFKFKFLKNVPEFFSFEGKILTPLNKTDQPMSYTAALGNQEFLFSVTFPTNFEIPAFNAILTLTSNSAATIQMVNGDFLPSVNLYGKMKINTSGLNLAEVTFSQLKIQTIEPYLSVQSFEMATGQFSGFPLAINSIGLRTEAPNFYGISMNVSVNFAGDNSGFSGATSFTVWAKKEGTGFSTWSFNRFEVTRVDIAVNTGPFTLTGYLEKYDNHAIYGNGFKGAIQATLNLDSFSPSLNVTAQFGNVNNYRYWYFDAQVGFATAIPVSGNFGVYGFGGGAYYHMRMEIPTSYQPSMTTGNPSATGTGQSVSGVTYVPDNSIFMGIKAGVIIGLTTNSKAFNGSAYFSVEFNNSGGLASLGFQGKAQFFKDINSTPANSEGVWGTLNIQYSFNEHILCGNSQAYVNLAFMQGGGANFLAGSASFYFAPGEWQILVGTPTQPISVKLFNSASATTYFMAGHDLPPFPGLPSNLASLAGSLNDNRNFTLTGNGSGFAIGSSVSINTGEKTFLAFYGNFNLGLGYDIMLRNYENASCVGSTGPLGINGWYATGQAYAWIDATIGVKVKVFQKERKFNIIDANVAALMYAQLPNPTYLKGIVSGSFSVCGGLVSGTCNFEVTYGDQCEIEGGSAVSGIEAIAEIAPANQATSVSVFVKPQVAFNIPIDQEFQLDDNGNVKTFRMTMDYFKLYQGTTEIQSASYWNENKSVLALRPTAVMAGTTLHKLTVKVHFQYKENNIWKDYKVNNIVEGETRELNFTTGEMPDHLVPEVISYTYPVDRMVNFYKQETNTGYIQLNQDFYQLFQLPGSWNYKARFIAGTQTLETNLAYSRQTQRATFSIPANMANNTIYSLQIMRVPVTATTTINVNQNVTETQQNLSAEVQTKRKDIEGVLVVTEEKELYKLYFRSSMYNTFALKINSLALKLNSSEVISTQVRRLKLKFEGQELLDKWECENLKMEAVLNQNYWYNNHVITVYTGYPINNNISISNRNTILLGVPPVKTTFLFQENMNYLITENNILLGDFSYNENVIRFFYEFNIPEKDDLFELRQKALNYYDASNTQIVNLANLNYVGLLLNNTYQFKINYILPGGTSPNSQVDKEFTFLQ